MSVINLMISVDDEHMKDISSIARKLRNAGLRVSQQLDEVGVITGTIEEGAVGRLRDVSGISAIEQQHVVYKAKQKAKAGKLQSAA